jgi:hypothetical protein
VLLNNKIFFTSTLIHAAGCGSETFRAWRNRNGLFPETKGKTGWNKFSIIDMMVTSIVTELTKRGVMAQTAVDAGNAAAPVLAEAFGKRLANVDRCDLEEIFRRLADDITDRKQVLTFNVDTFDRCKVSVKLQSRRAAVVDTLEGLAAIVLDTLLILIPVFRLLLNGGEIELDGGGRKRLPGLSPVHEGLLRAAESGDWKNFAREATERPDTNAKFIDRAKARRGAVAKRGR